MTTLIREQMPKKLDPWAVLRECQAEHYSAAPAELELIALIPPRNYSNRSMPRARQ